jgi:acyl-CoA reductase-like NAD-dependent aldehyde dehydrogenase
VRPDAARQAPRVYTQRGPLLGVISAITPFNHPMNQVAHKVVPAVATNNRMVLKPREGAAVGALLRRPALRAGLPPRCSRSSPATRARSPTSSSPTRRRPRHLHRRRRDRQGDRRQGGYRRIVLELGGNDPIIVMDDADLDEASTLAVQGSYKNSGQRCTAIKRMLVHQAVAPTSPSASSKRRSAGATAIRATPTSRWAP